MRDQRYLGKCADGNRLRLGVGTNRYKCPVKNIERSLGGPHNQSLLRRVSQQPVKRMIEVPPRRLITLQTIYK